MPGQQWSAHVAKRSLDVEGRFAVGLLRFTAKHNGYVRAIPLRTMLLYHVPTYNTPAGRVAGSACPGPMDPATSVFGPPSTRGYEFISVGTLATYIFILFFIPLLHMSVTWQVYAIYVQYILHVERLN